MPIPCEIHPEARRWDALYRMDIGLKPWRCHIPWRRKETKARLAGTMRRPAGLKARPFHRFRSMGGGCSSSLAWSTPRVWGWGATAGAITKYIPKGVKTILPKNICL